MASSIIDISTMAAFLRPMYCDRMPSGKRMNAPANVGTETIKPVCAALNLKLSEMNGPIAPFKTQTANEKSK